MVDILHRIGVVAPLDQVYRSIATPEGIAGWWTTDTAGKSEVGNELAFRFGDAGGFDMEVLELDPAGRVRWRVTGGPEEWIEVGDLPDEPQGVRGDGTRQAVARRRPDQRLALTSGGMSKRTQSPDAPVRPATSAIAPP
jgi:uncharacterized protein YndB with AHSA1/START domain